VAFIPEGEAMVSDRTRAGIAAYLFLILIVLGVSPAQAQPVVADGYDLDINCPNITAEHINTTLGVGASLNLGQMALSHDGRFLYIIYTPGAAGPGSVHVRDLRKCTQKVLIADIDGPLGIAVHPDTHELFISHRYVNEEFVEGVDPHHKKYRGAISIYSRWGQLLWEKEVKGFAPSICCNHPAPANFGNGAQGLNFDRAGNLYVAMNLDVHETEAYAGFHPTGSLYKITPAGEVSVFATGLRAPFEAIVAETNHFGVATAFYAGDNGEGDFCTPLASADCTERIVPGSSPVRALSRMYYDELNYVVKGGHYGYPESAPTAIVPFSAADHVSHIGPLWIFDKTPSTAFGFPGVLNPVPTGLALIDGRWGKVVDPLFMTFWSGQRIDMFTGPNRSKRTTLVGNLLGRVTDVVTHDDNVYVSEEITRLIYRVRPKQFHGFPWWPHSGGDHDSE
jgi:hypothetical protein